MQRDMELIRKILLTVEEHEKGRAPDPLKVEGYTKDQIEYHAYIMIQGGLAEGNITTNMMSSGPTAIINNLTFEGHDFIDAARDNSIWQKVKAQISAQGKQLSSMPLEIIKLLLVSNLKSGLGL